MPELQRAFLVRTMNCCLLLLLLVVVMEQRRVGRAHHVAVHGGVVEERHIGVHSRSMLSEEWIARFSPLFWTAKHTCLLSRKEAAPLIQGEPEQLFPPDSSSKSLDDDT